MADTTSPATTDGPMGGSAEIAWVAALAENDRWLPTELPARLGKSAF
jgi:hypothetical protein